MKIGNKQFTQVYRNTLNRCTTNATTLLRLHELDCKLCLQNHIIKKWKKNKICSLTLQIKIKNHINIYVYIYNMNSLFYPRYICVYMCKKQHISMYIDSTAGTQLTSLLVKNNNSILFSKNLDEVILKCWKINWYWHKE